MWCTEKTAECLEQCHKITAADVSRCFEPFDARMKQRIYCDGTYFEGDNR